MTTARKGTIAGTVAAVLFSAFLLNGCESAQQKANDAAVAQAKQQAAASGNAQQVVSTDGDGNTVTTVVQPPAPGQTTQTVTVTKTKTTSTATNVQQPIVGPANGAPLAPNSAGYGAGAGSAPPPSGPAQPVITPVDVHIPAGTTLAIRINESINVKHTHAGDRFTGEVVEPVVMENGSVAVPKGTPVAGVVDEAHRRGHFKGASILELRLTSMNLNGQRYSLDTHDNVRTKKGKGKRSAAFIGGGSGLGMLVGGVATGGVGLLVGGLVGGGVGTAVGGLTGNRDLDIPAESIVHFKLADDLVVQPS